MGGMHGPTHTLTRARELASGGAHFSSFILFFPSPIPLLQKDGWNNARESLVSAIFQDGSEVKLEP